MLKIGDTVVWMHEPYTPLVVTEITGAKVRAENETHFCEANVTEFIKTETEKTS